MSEFSNGINPSEFEIKKPILPPAQEVSSISEQTKNPQELTNDRIQRLEDLAKDFTLDQTSSAIRVHEFLMNEDTKEKDKKWSKYLKNIDDWKLYHQLNPDWQGLNVGKISKDKEGIKFYDSFSGWTKKETRNLKKEEQKQSRKKLIEAIFPPQYKDRSNLKTIEDWVNEFNKNPDWQELNQSEIKKKEGGHAFLSAFISWTKTQNSPRELSRIIFPIEGNDWSQLKTIELWQERLIEEKQSLEWDHLDKNKLQKNFKQQFNNWIKKTTKDPIEREKIYVQLFSRENEYAEFNSVEEFKREYKKNPEWKDLSLTDIALPKNKAFSSFYYHLRKFSMETYSSLPKEEQVIAATNLRDKIIKPTYKFKNKGKEWSNLTSIEQWLEEKDKLGWSGLNRKEIYNQNGSTFCKEFSKFITQKSKDIPSHKQKHFLNKMRVVLYGKTLGEYSHFNSKKEFIEEWQKHPEWQNKNTKEICKIGGEAFYRAYNRFKKEIIDEIPKSERQKTEDELKFSKVFLPSQKDINTEEKNIKQKVLTIYKKETNKVENYPEIIIPKSPGKTIIFDDKEDINFSDGFTLGNVETTSIKTNSNGNGFNNIRYSISVDNLTDSQRLRLLTGREDQNPELYAKNIGQLATYVVHRGEIGFLLNLFSQNKLDFPKIIADFGAGPSTAYSAYEQLTPTIEEYGFSKPQIIDIEKNGEMSKFGKNPNKIEGDITQKISLDNQTVDMVQSTFVIHHFKSSEIYKTLSEANRVTKNGGYLSLICSCPFSQSFLDGVENLGYQVITDHGAVLTPNSQMIAALSQEFDSETAKRFQNRFNSSFILFAKKNTDVSEINQFQSLEAFTFDQVKKNTRERRPILDLKNYNIETSPLTENIERVTDSIVYQLHQLEVSPLRQKGGLIPGGNEIRSNYEIFNYNLNSIQSLYDKIYNKIKNQFNTLTPEQIDKFNQLKENLRTVKEYKKYFYQRHIR